MATNLTEASYYSRTAIKIGVILLVGILFVRGAFIFTGNIYDLLKPEQKPEPNYKFGTKLPEIKFPDQGPIPTLNFQLETIDNKLPVLSEIGTVYFIPLQTYSLLTLENAKQKASAHGFTEEPRQLPGIAETTYQWRKGAEVGATFTMKIINQNFDLRYEYEKDQSILNSPVLLVEENAIKAANDALQKGGFYRGDLAAGPKKTIYLRYDPKGLQKVYTPLDADFIRVNYQRSDINSLPVLSADPLKTNVSVLISKKKKEPEVEIGFNYYPINTTSEGTYPLKSTIEAFAELKNGRAFIANLGDNRDGDVKIRRTYLAYFDPATPQNYLQPIIVFEGDNDFVAYVPALHSNAISQSASSSGDSQ